MIPPREIQIPATYMYTIATRAIILKCIKHKTICRNYKTKRLRKSMHYKYYGNHQIIIFVQKIRISQIEMTKHDRIYMKHNLFSILHFHLSIFSISNSPSWERR